MPNYYPPFEGVGDNLFTLKGKEKIEKKTNLYKERPHIEDT